ncbi:MAG: hypothetical protein KAX78_06135 [Phycisphaerae bacterium]|nr:hypothetical protein [Phycisphaerae bacterium]
MAADDATKGIDYTGFETLNLSLGGGNDDFTIDATHTGLTNLYAGGGDDEVVIETISGVTNLSGEAGDDEITVNDDLALPDTLNGLAAVLNLDGQSGSDDYIVNAFGNGDSLINVFDTGAVNDGVDLLTVNGTADPDQFLLRANFAAVLVDTDQDGTFDTAERINYDQNLNEGIVLNGLGDNDHFASDDNSATTTLNGGAGNDTFQIGQVFNADRLPPHVAGGDEIVTTHTTVGYLTNGASLPLTANGGAGEDEFVVFRNLAPVSLNGGADNDTFTVRAFALAQTGQMDPNQQQTQVDGGEGADVIEYAINAPVSINGGDGLDIVRVLGTEFGDRFVVTYQGVYGAGLFVAYVGVESVELHAGDGDDEIYVLSTSAAVKTSIFGGAGSDHFYVGENAPVVVANDLRGHTGLIDHTIDTAIVDRDPAYDEVTIVGLDVNVTDNDASDVVLIESGGQTRISENGLTDSYSIRLSRAPTANVTVTVSSPILPPEITSLGGAALRVSTGGGTPASALTLVFTPANWNTPQTVTVHAVNDTLGEQTEVLPIMHSVISADSSYHALAIRSVPVQIIDNDSAGVIITPSGVSTDVLEGGFTDTYILSLTHAPSGPVSIQLDGDSGLALSQTTVTLDDSNWNTGVAVSVSASDDVLIEGPQVLRIGHSVLTGAAGRDTSFDAITIGAVEVNIFDNDAPGVIVTPTDGSTDVLEGGISDTYTVQLTQQPAGTVTVEVQAIPTPTTSGGPGDVQVSTSATALTFTPANWDTPQVVSVWGIDDAVEDDPAAQGFAKQLRTLTGIGGPLFIEGAGGDVSIFGIPVPVMLPTESDTAGGGSGSAVHSAQEAPGDVDVLDIVDIDAVADDSGVLTGTNLSGLGMGGDLVLETSAGIFETIPQGITYGTVEIIELQLGSGNETLDVQSVASDAITVVRGHAGDDTFNVSAADAPAAMLVMYGDTAAGDTHRGLGGDDTIDASAAGLGATYYGGVGNDTILGGAGEDRVAGGSGDDVLGGGSGNDLILGDSGFNVVRETRITSIVFTGLPGEDDFDDTGNDIINPGDGQDSVFGDHGVITQDGGTTGVLTEVGALASAWTVNPHLGGDDTISANANAHAAFGGQDVVFGGDDLIFAGAGNDTIIGGSGRDVLLGDVGIIRLDIDSDLGTVDRIRVDLPGVGGDDAIEGGDADDLILGGFGGDTIAGNAGNDVIIGDSGRILLTGGVIERIETTDPAIGGPDTISGGTDRDVILGGVAGDNISGGAENDVIIGDNGFVDYTIDDGDPSDIDQISVAEPNIGGGDIIDAGAGNDIVLAGTAGDTVHGGQGNDLIFGDHGIVSGEIDATLLPLAMQNDPFTFTAIYTQDTQGGGSDELYGDGGDDIILGQQGADTIYGGSEHDDLIGGHNVSGGHDGGDSIDGGAGNDAIAGDNAVILRRGDAVSPRFRILNGTTLYADDGSADVGPEHQSDPRGAAGRDITLLDHSDSPPAATFGGDYIAGGPNDDVIFAQLGDDVVQGDASIAEFVSAADPSMDGPDDGDDYIEGNGGNDLIFGNQGQDDIIGGSSDLFGLSAPTQRPDGSDWIFGGSGTAAARNTMGDLSDDAHARDADVILGDNGIIYRPVLGGALLSFNYDTYAGAIRIVASAYDLLDYTPGYGAADIGTGDLIHGESGDDVIHGMAGNDILFGDAQDDDLYGGNGDDWISGGSGHDGILGDDGKIQTARNGLSEPLYRLEPTTEQTINTPANHFLATIHEAGRLKKSVDLEPFDLGGKDVMYGGLGDDFMHGQAGDDALSGAEAIAAFYDAAAGRFGISIPDPIVAPTAILFDEVVGEFTDYNENDPWSKVENHALNFEAADPEGAKIDDGRDVIFGDLGNDWLVGGTNEDHIYGGLGSDLLNADDNLDTLGGANTQPDPDPFADADIAYGGGGRDVLIANTGADRLVDWAGEFNSYVVPFGPFGAFTVNRALMPRIPEFLYALSEADGADQTLGTDATRNGEPYGELGLVLQKDRGNPDWADQTGGPGDPQPGNIGGMRKDKFGTGPQTSSSITYTELAQSAEPISSSYLSDFDNGISGAPVVASSSAVSDGGDGQGDLTSDPTEADLASLGDLLASPLKKKLLGKLK